MMKKILFFLLLTSFITGYAQSVGDYRSQNDGMWSQPGTWEVWNGTAWITLTSGYPGKPPVPPAIAGSATTPTGTPTSTVTITHTVTIPIGQDMQTAPYANPPIINLLFGDLIIKSEAGRIGNLIIQPDVGTTVNFLSTQNVLIDYGKMTFAEKKLYVKFPAGAQININLPAGTCSSTTTGIGGYGIVVSSTSDCNNNVELWIGDALYSTCTGNGGQPLGGDFCAINNAGGSVSATATPASLCSGGSVTLSGQEIANATYIWSLYSGPTGYTIPSGTPLNVRILALTLSIPGTYI